MPATFHETPPGEPPEGIAWLAALRPDERSRAARHFRPLDLEPGKRERLAPTGAPPAGFVLAGSVRVRRPEFPGLPPTEARLEAGDRFGELGLFAAAGAATGADAAEGSATEIEAVDGPARLALLDRAAFERLCEEFPIVWMEVSTRLSRELKWKNDLLREIREFGDTHADAASLDLYLSMRRRKLARRHAGISRARGERVYQALVARPRREPAFWILAGFLAAIAVSRTVVAFILRFGLEDRLFNLRDAGGPNPIHLHHFNYGFAVLIAAGLLSLLPQSRRLLRPLATAFGVGLGLVFDEFALLWRLNPDYYDPLSYWAQGVMALVLAQLAFLRRPYAGLWRRIGGGAR